MSLIDIRNMNHNTTNGPLLKFQMGSDRAVETNDARDNWSSNGSDQRGYTKHHQVPWFTLKKIMNHALLKLQNDQNQKLWGKIIKAAYVGGNAGSNLAPLKKTTKWLGSSPNMGGLDCCRHGMRTLQCRWHTKMRSITLALIFAGCLEIFS